MKTIILTLATIITAGLVAAQTVNFGETKLKNLDGFNVPANEMLSGNGYTLIISWKQGENIENLKNLWSESFEEMDVKVVAVCIDGNGSWGHIKPLVSARLWNIDVFVDVNGDFKRTTNFATTGAVLLNENNEIVYRLYGLSEGSADLICDIIESGNSRLTLK